MSTPLHRASFKADALAQKDDGVGPYFSELRSHDVAEVWAVGTVGVGSGAAAAVAFNLAAA